MLGLTWTCFHQKCRWKKTKHLFTHEIPFLLLTTIFRCEFKRVHFNNPYPSPWRASVSLRVKASVIVWNVFRLFGDPIQIPEFLYVQYLHVSLIFRLKFHFHSRFTCWFFRAFIHVGFISHPLSWVSYLYLCLWYLFFFFYNIYFCLSLHWKVLQPYHSSEQGV